MSGLDIGVGGAHAPPAGWNQILQGQGLSLIALDYPCSIRHIGVEEGIVLLLRGAMVQPDTWL